MEYCFYQKVTEFDIVDIHTSVDLDLCVGVASSENKIVVLP